MIYRFFHLRPFQTALPVPMIHLLLVRFLGLERLTASYSNLNLTKALASVIGPMVAGNSCRNVVGDR